MANISNAPQNHQNWRQVHQKLIPYLKQIEYSDSFLKQKLRRKGWLKEALRQYAYNKQISVYTEHIALEGGNT